MKIAYGVMGYGRGHAMRTAAVLPALMAEHEITVFAGDDAYDVLAPQFPCVRIPTLGYRYNARGGHSWPQTIAQNFTPMSDLLLRGPGARSVEREFRIRGIELVISDSEAWTHRAAQRLRLPRIGFDHVGVIAYCKPHFPSELWLAGRRDAWAYRYLMGEPERILISSFYPAEPSKSSTKIIGPLLREAVRSCLPTRGDYLLAYFNKGQHLYQESVDRALRLLDLPVVVYGTARRGRCDNLEFRAPSNEGFVRDLAGCKAVIATAGNQLIGEAIHFGKPILALPENAFEQRLNAWMIEQMGVGRRADIRTFSPSDVDRFLSDCETFRERTTEYAQDGRADAVDTLGRFIEELKSATRSGRRSARPAFRRLTKRRKDGLEPSPSSLS